MFSHFFTRSWLRWTATKYLQAHVAHALRPRGRHDRPMVRLDLAVRCAPTSRKPPLAHSQCYPTIAPTKRLKLATRPFGVRALASRAEKTNWLADQWTDHTHKQREDRLHVSIKRARPAAVSPNGGLRGSKATAWSR